MDVFTMVVIIVTVSVGAGVINNYLKTQRKQAESRDAEGLEAEVAELRARVEVLEKIVTDDKYTLNKELNALQ